MILSRSWGHTYASELLKQVVDLNRGIFWMKNSSRNIIQTFVLEYLDIQKSTWRPQLELDMKYLKKKVDKGADYIVTQMFFDTQKYIDFVTK